MGLFSSVLHVRDKSRETVLHALDAILHTEGFSRTETVPVTTESPYALPNHDASVSAGPYYLVSPLKGHWLTIIEAHFALHSEGAPHSSDLGNRLSGALSCYTLALMVHDDDLFFYNLDRNGESLDGYNSCPQYFEQDRLSDEQVEEQRHTPEAFRPLLPTSSSLDELRALLNRGWWSAYDSGNLDENGVAQGDDDGFGFEGERMAAFGNLLRLHGDQGEYPYAAWGEEEAGIDWPEFVALRYRKPT
jgi:hypothetical protein